MTVCMVTYMDRRKMCSLKLKLPDLNDDDDEDDDNDDDYDDDDDNLQQNTMVI